MIRAHERNIMQPKDNSPLLKCKQTNNKKEANGKQWAKANDINSSSPMSMYLKILLFVCTNGWCHHHIFYFTNDRQMWSRLVDAKSHSQNLNVSSTGPSFNPTFNGNLCVVFVFLFYFLYLCWFLLFLFNSLKIEWPQSNVSFYLESRRNNN